MFFKVSTLENNFLLKDRVIFLELFDWPTWFTLIYAYCESNLSGNKKIDTQTERKGH